ncbi:hypothetical protein [uncultured Bacteroides sp.]|uniref:hypothetical protein n=1 Tax=uncultured Bacteroides sp. TaxID=162156 RepID=UPI0026295CDB|nr:hypothetical protein [uncultured Bacteroides sp.]
MTNILLTIIAVLLLARIVLQIKQGKRAVEKGYAASSEVETQVVVCNRSQYHIREVCDMMSSDRWELVAAHRTKNQNEILFFTRKKIKNYYEE